MDYRQDSSVLLGKAAQHFAVLMRGIGNPEGAKQVLKDLIARYEEPHRHYHVLAHIVFMLDEFKKIEYLAENKRAVMAAIWYHDVVYHTDTGLIASFCTNEQSSSLLASRDLSRLGARRALIAKVVRLIQATDHKTVTPVIDRDTQILLDLDLLVLGQDDATFDEFEKNIRKEYAHVEESRYKEGRIEVLSMFLQRDRIYHLPFMQEVYGEKAKENIRRAIRKLSAE